jgi:hypothetical protein
MFHPSQVEFADQATNSTRGATRNATSNISQKVLLVVESTDAQAKMFGRALCRLGVRHHVMDNKALVQRTTNFNESVLGKRGSTDSKSESPASKSEPGSPESRTFKVPRIQGGAIGVSGISGGNAQHTIVRLGSNAKAFLRILKGLRRSRQWFEQGQHVLMCLADQSGQFDSGKSGTIVIFHETIVKNYLDTYHGTHFKNLSDSDVRRLLLELCGEPITYYEVDIARKCMPINDPVWASISVDIGASLHAISLDRLDRYTSLDTMRAITTSHDPKITRSKLVGVKTCVCTRDLPRDIGKSCTCTTSGPCMTWGRPFDEGSAGRVLSTKAIRSFRDGMANFFAV